MKSRQGNPDKEKEDKHGTVRIHPVQSEGEDVAVRSHPDPHRQHGPVLGAAARIRLRPGHHPGWDLTGIRVDQPENIEEASLEARFFSFF